MKKSEYLDELEKLQIELVHLQEWVKHKNLKVMVVFEGRDAAGKGGMIRAISSRLSHRVVKVVALAKPTDQEKSQWYFQRYINHLPSGGQIALFDRSWYNRAGVEKVMGFCTDEQYEAFLNDCPEFENMLLRSGIILIKYWLSVSEEEQEKRFEERLKNPLKRWKFSDMDVYARSRWHDYSIARDTMFARTDTTSSPWYIVDSDDKKAARLNCIRHLLEQIPYEKLDKEKIKLPKIDTLGYKRTSWENLNHVPKKYE